MDLLFSAALAVVVSIFVFSSVEIGYRVLSDKTNLISLSKSLFVEKTPYNATMGFWYYDTYHPFNFELPLRPILFPFFINILHILSGYRAANVFVLNFLILVTLLFLGSELARRIGGYLFAVCLMLLIICQPIVSLVATSAGFDLFSTLWLACLYICLWTFLKQPSRQKMSLLWITGLALANTRYESAIHLVIVALVLLIWNRKDLFRCFNPVFILFSSIGFLPIFLQMMLMKGKYQNPDHVTVLSFSGSSVEFVGELWLG